MSFLAARFASLALALALDLALGDPETRLHPVRLLGALISAEERALRRSRLPEFAAGCVLAAVTCAVAVVAASGTSGLTRLAAAAFVPRAAAAVAIVADALVIYLALAGRSLADEGARVLGALQRGDLDGARRSVARVVGRDTDRLDEGGVARAAIETLGENAVDALVAPLFWAALLGPAGAWLHKAASTLDSMVGYRDERYERFGKASARVDDVLAWLPARLAVPAVTAAAALVGLDAPRTLKVALRDRLLHASPNSAHGEAAFAGALGVSLGGVSHYAGIPSERPRIAPELGEPVAADLASACRLLLGLSALALALSLAGAVAAYVL